MVLDAKSGERCLVKAREDELLLARIEVDVADGEYPGQTRLELLRIDEQRLPLERKTPVGDGPELRMQPEEHEELVGGERMSDTVGRLHVHAGETAVLDDERLRQRLQVADAPGRGE